MSELMKVIICVKRVDSFLCAEEMKDIKIMGTTQCENKSNKPKKMTKEEAKIAKKEMKNRLKTIALEIKDGCFERERLVNDPKKKKKARKTGKKNEKQVQTFRIQDMNLLVKKGQLVTIVGSVGSGFFAFFLFSCFFENKCITFYVLNRKKYNFGCIYWGNWNGSKHKN